MLRNSVPTRRWIFAGIALALVTALAPGAAIAGSDESYKKSPGYVDFAPILGDMESSVEVFLKGSLLVLAREAVKDEDPELGDLLSNISYVRVQVFPADKTTAPVLKEKVLKAGNALEKKGWEMTVRVREDDQQVLIYLLPGKGDAIQGLVVMAVEEGEDAAFINVVGDINPAEIGRIGRAFHIKSIDAPLKIEVEGNADVTVGESAKKDR